MSIAFRSSVSRKNKKAPEFCFKQFYHIVKKSQHGSYALCVFFDDDVNFGYVDDEHAAKLCSWSKNWTGDESVEMPESIGGFERYHRRLGNIILPVYEYCHSGSTISLTPFSCRWDSGQAGYVLWEESDIKKYFGVDAIDEETRKKALDFIKGLVEYYDQILRGNVYGYRIFKYNFETLEWEDIDSCWGFVGELDEILTYIDMNVRKDTRKKLMEKIQDA